MCVWGDVSNKNSTLIVKLQVLGLELGVDFTFTWDNNQNKTKSKVFSLEKLYPLSQVPIP